MSCLGERLTALVDGELDHDERDRALAHLAGCAECRAEADTLRRLKDRLRSLAAPPLCAPPEPVTDDDADIPSADFLRRLYALGEQPDPLAAPLVSPLAPGRSGWDRPLLGPGSSAAFGAPGLFPSLPSLPSLPALAARRMPRRRYLAAGAAAMMLGIGGASYALGGREPGDPPVVPAFQQMEMEHALTGGTVPLTDFTPRP